MLHEGGLLTNNLPPPEAQASLPWPRCGGSATPLSARRTCFSGSAPRLSRPGSLRVPTFLDRRADDHAAVAAHFIPSLDNELGRNLTDNDPIDVYDREGS